MRLKVVSRSTQKVVSIQDESTLKQLVQLLVDEQIINDGKDLVIKVGFPPKPLDLKEEETKLLDVGVRAGDKLIVEEGSGSSRGNAPSSAGSSQASAPASSSSTSSSSSSSSSQKQKQRIELTQKSRGKVGPKTVSLGDGSVRLHPITDNNSCLFESLKYLTESSINLREIVAQYILADPVNYNDAILGKPADEYVAWITKSTSWGGAIELQILSLFLDVTINSIDVENGRVDSFNPDALNYIVILYTGIHYDAVLYTGDSGETKIFNKSSKLGKEFLEGAKQLSKSLNHKGYVTNTNTFQVKCKTCGKILDGEKKVTEHATNFKHFDFGEV